MTLAALWTSVHVVFFGEPRYHMPLIAIGCPTIGAVIVWMLRLDNVSVANPEIAEVSPRTQDVLV